MLISSDPASDQTDWVRVSGALRHLASLGSSETTVDEFGEPGAEDSATSVLADVILLAEKCRNALAETHDAENDNNFFSSLLVLLSCYFTSNLRHFSAQHIESLMATGRVLLNAVVKRLEGAESGTAPELLARPILAKLLEMVLGVETELSAINELTKQPAESTQAIFDNMLMHSRDHSEKSTLIKSLDGEKIDKQGEMSVPALSKRLEQSELVAAYCVILNNCFLPASLLALRDSGKSGALVADSASAQLKRQIKSSILSSRFSALDSEYRERVLFSTRESETEALFFKSNLAYIASEHGLSALIKNAVGSDFIAPLGMKFEDMQNPETCAFMTTDVSRCSSQLESMKNIAIDLKFFSLVTVISHQLPTKMYKEYEELLICTFELFAASLSYILSEVCCNLAASKKGILREDDGAVTSQISACFNVVSRILPRSLEAFSDLKQKFLVFTAWLELNFLQNLSLAHQGITSSDKIPSGSKTPRQSSRSFSYRSGSGSNVLSAAVLSITKHFYSILPVAIKTTDIPCSPRFAHCSVIREFLLTVTDLTTITFWLLGAVLKRAIFLVNEDSNKADSAAANPQSILRTGEFLEEDEWEKNEKKSLLKKGPKPPDRAKYHPLSAETDSDGGSSSSGEEEEEDEEEEDRQMEDDGFDDGLNDSGNEAILRMLFREESFNENAGKNLDVSNEEKSTKADAYFEACDKMLRLLQDAFSSEASIMLNNICTFLGSTQVSQLAVMIRELDTRQRSASKSALRNTGSLLLSFTHSLVSSAAMNRERKLELLAALGMDLERRESGDRWPLAISSPRLAILAHVLVDLGDDELVFGLWWNVIGALGDLCHTAQWATVGMDDLSALQFQLLQLTFLMLSDEKKKSVLNMISRSLINISQSPDFTDQPPLLLSRMLLLFECSVNYYDRNPEELTERINHNLFSASRHGFFSDRDVKFSRCAEVERFIEMHSGASFDGIGPMSSFSEIIGVFYDIGSVEKTSPYHLPRVNKEGFKALLGCGVPYGDILEALIKLLPAGFAVSKKMPQDSTRSLYDYCSVHYCFNILWRFLSVLPPSFSHLEAILKSDNFGTEVNALYSIQWLDRLFDESYSSVIKDSLIRETEEAEKCEDLLKSKSPAVLSIISGMLQKICDSLDPELRPGKSLHLPEFSVLMVLDCLVARCHSAIDIQRSNGDLDIPVALNVLTVVQSLVTKIMAYSRNWVLAKVIEKLKEEVMTTHTLNIYDLILQSDVKINLFQNILSSAKFSASEDVLDLLTGENDRLKEHLLAWKSCRAGAFPDPWTGKNQNQTLTSDAYASQVALGHVRTLSMKGKEGQLPRLQHSASALLNLLADLSMWMPADKLDGEMIRSVCGSTVAAITNETCDCKDQLAAFLSEFCTKVYSKPAEDCTVAVDTAVRHVVRLAFDIIVTNSRTEWRFPDELYTTCLARIRDAAFAQSALLLSVTDSLFVSETRNFFQICLSLQNPNFSFEVCRAIVGFIARLLKEGSGKSTLTQHAFYFNRFERLDEEIVKSILHRIFSLKPYSLESMNDVKSSIATICHQLVHNSIISETVPERFLELLIPMAMSVFKDPTVSATFEGIISVLLVLADYNKGAGHVTLFKAAVSAFSDIEKTIGEMVQTDSIKLLEDDNDFLKALNSLLAYIVDVLATIRTHDKFSGASMESGSLETEMAAIDATIDLEMEVSSDDQIGDDSDDDKQSRQLCTFTLTQKDFMNQHWYHCYTCSMNDSVGVCSVCAKLCHKDHDVSYAKYGSFYCDCGAKGETHCMALSKRTVKDSAKASRGGAGGASSNVIHVTASSKREYPVFKWSNLESESRAQASHFESHKDKLVELASGADFDKVVRLLALIRPLIDQHLENTSPSSASKRLCKAFDNLHEAKKNIVSVDNLIQYAVTSPEAAFENVKMNFSGEHSTTIRQLVTAHMIKRVSLCVLASPSNNQRQYLIVAHDKGVVTSLQLSSLLKQTDSVPRKLNVTRLSSNSLPFTVLCIAGNAVNEDYLAVSGLKDCHILIFNQEGSVSSQIALNPGLEAGNFIIKAIWIPGSQTQLAIVTADYLKIYDLAVDTNNPQYFYHLLSGKLRDVTFLVEGSTVNMLVMSSQGFIYTQCLDEQSRADNGPFYVTNTVIIENPELKLASGQFAGGGVSIYYSHTLQMLFCSYSCGKSFACSLKKLEDYPTSTVLGELFPVSTSTALVQWKEVDEHPGLIICSCQRTATPFVILVKPSSFETQEVKLSSNRTKVLDIVAIRNVTNASQKRTSLMLLCDDGSLKIYNANPDTSQFWLSPSFYPALPAPSRKRTKAPTGKLKQQVASVPFPIDFFENCQLISEVEYGGNDFLQIYNSQQMKNRINSANLYIASSKSGPITLEIMNENSSQVIAGLRVQVGNQSVDKSPSYLEVFDRQIAVEGVSGSKWIDIPFTNEECLLSEKSVALTIGATRDNSGITIVDSVKVYGKNRDNIGDTTPTEANPTTSRSELKKLSLSRQESDSPANSESAFDNFLAYALEVLSCYFSLQETDRNCRAAKEALDFSSSLLVCPLSASVVAQNAALLLALYKSKPSMYLHTDEVMIKFISRPNHLQSVTHENFERHLTTIKVIAQSRAHNLLKFSPLMVNKDSGEKVCPMLEDVMGRFWTIIEERKDSSLLVPLVNQTRYHLDNLVSTVVEILFAYALQDSELMPHSMTHLVTLLLYHDPQISFTAKSALIKLTRPRTVRSGGKLRDNKRPSSSSGTSGAASAAASQRNSQEQTSATFAEADVLFREMDAAAAQAGPSVDVANVPTPVTQNSLEALLGAAAAADADDETMMELAIALSLQEQGADALAETVEVMEEADDLLETDDANDEPAVLVPAAAAVAQVNLMHQQPQDNVSDTTASAVGSDDEGSTAATDGSTLPADNITAGGSGPGSESGNSVGESVTASASSSAYGGEETNMANTGAVPKSDQGANAGGEGANSASVMFADDSNQKLADSRVDMLKLMMNYFPQVRKVGGIRAIPFLQVFLSLSCELENEGTISLVLNNVITHLNLSVDSRILDRDHGKEVQVLLMRLLSVYMAKSRVVKTPSDDETSPACLISKMTAYELRMHGIIPYCLAVLMELLPHWQSIFTSSELDAAQIKLLKVQPSQNPPDMTPFFLPQYVLGHAADVFEGYHQLLTEMVLRLPYQIYRLLDTTGSPDEDLREKWISVLSEYMMLPLMHFVKRQVRKLLLFICGSKDSYRQQRDVFAFKHHYDAIRAIYPVEDDSAHLGRGSVSYATLISIIDHMKVIVEVASSRSLNWQRFCSSNPSVLPFLMRLVTKTDEHVHSYTLELIMLATCGSKVAAQIKSTSVADKNKKTNAKESSSSTVKYSNADNDDDMAGGCSQNQADADEETGAGFVNSLLQSEPDAVWRDFIKVYMLQCNQSTLRWQTHGLIHNMWVNAAPDTRGKLLDVMWMLWEDIPAHGKLASQFVDLLGFITLKSDATAESRNAKMAKLMAMLKSQNVLIKNHPNFVLYEQLARLVDFDGFYLESDPCLICNNLESNYQAMKLSSIKADSRFTTVTQIIKLTGAYQINKINFRISDINSSKMVKTLNVYYNKRAVSSVVDLKNNPQVWHKARKIELEAGQTEVKIDFALPVVATNLMVEFCDFYENFHATNESLQCPRCSSSVMANPGICSNCGENVYQCHKCRQINYDEKDPFLCNSCGYCKYAKFDLVLTAKQCVAIDPIENEEDRKKALTNINSLLEKADRIYRTILGFRPAMEDLLNALANNSRDIGSLVVEAANAPNNAALAAAAVNPGHVHKVIQQLASKYFFDCKSSFDELSKITQKVAATRAELVEYDRRTQSSSRNAREVVSSAPPSPPHELSSQKCFGCLVQSSLHCVYLLKAFCSHPESRDYLVENGLLNELLGNNLKRGTAQIRGFVRQLVFAVCKNNPVATANLCRYNLSQIVAMMKCLAFSADLDRVIRDELLLLTEGISLHDGCWQIRIRALTQLITVSVSSKSQSVIAFILLPCMRALNQLILNKKDSPATGGRRVDLRDWFLDRNFYSNWQNSDRIKEVEFEPESWLKCALFHSGSQAVRSTACSILANLARDEMRCKAIIRLLSAYMDEFQEANETITEVVSLFQRLIKRDETKLQLTSTGFLNKLAGMIIRDIESFARKERAGCHADLSQGFGLKSFVDLLSSFLNVAEILNSEKQRLIQPVLQGFLALKKLVTQRTKLIDEAQEMLLEMLDLMTTGTMEETKEFMKICITTLNNFPEDDQLTPIFVFERLCNVIHPEETDVTEFFVSLEKDPQQEDFLLGRMQGNPYSCNETGIGPLMRDIKNKICRDCELVALLEDDSGMELLVNNKIISLNLPVKDVFRKIWVAQDGNSEQEPMRIVYRMRGLMGDATEEFIETLSSSSASEEGDDEEEQFKLAVTLGQCSGLQSMLFWLVSIKDIAANRQLLNVLLKLFSFAVKVKSNRQALVEPAYQTLPVFLSILELALECEEAATRDSLVESILTIMQPILQEAHTVESTQQNALQVSGDLNQLQQILGCTQMGHIQSNPSLLQNLMTIVPYLTFGDNKDEKMAALIEYFAPYLDFKSYDEEKGANGGAFSRADLFIECFISVAENIPGSPDGDCLKSAVVSSGITASLVEYIMDLVPDKECAADQKAWKEFLSRKSALPFVLRLLNGLCKRHEPTQLLISEKCIPILHRMERISSEEKVGSLAENLLESLKEHAEMSEKIVGARKHTKDEKKRLAMAMREKHLVALGMEATSGGRVVRTSTTGHSRLTFEDITEETGLICCICREGYKYHPNTVIGIYTFSKRHTLEPYESRSRKAVGYSTVTHFTTVHFDCHNNAVRSHRGRDEWESATLQNSDVKCNGLLPMWGSQISESQFAHALAKFNVHIQECTGHREPTYQTTLHDMKLLLLKFAEEKSFSEDCGGGARESNSKMLPYMMNIALYVMNSTRSTSRDDKLINQFIQDGEDKWVSSSYELDGPHYYGILFILLSPPAKWKEHRLVFLKRLLATQHARHLSHAAITSLPDKSPQPYVVYKPALLYWTMLDNLSKMLTKVPVEGGSRSWPVAVQEFIRNHDLQLLDFINKTLLPNFQEALTAMSFSEWCDVVGLLASLGEDPDAWIAAMLSRLP